ncbi:hypothetical protein GMA10_05945 [Kocuria koreensis]|uniref:Uncharacterized protein n=1 Tax=Rothia koreensis TaxID=592378 RepID=A0A7K1LHU1_9MICC|nr:hypothetical protein [Rothia koreensis]MUN54754.1 hypothetical protein [Rothia koreensis]
MTPEDVHGFLAWVNQHDPRVETSPVNVEVWGRAVGTFDNMVLKDVMLDYFARSGEKPAPSEIRRLAMSEVERREARQRALEGPKEQGPGFEKALRSHLNDPEFQRIRMEARVRWCETHDVEHDGDGWTAADRPTTARDGRTTALDDLGRF